MEFNFEKLEAYREIDAAVAVLLAEVSKWPVRYRRLTDQIIGASTSIVLNLAEGSGRESPKEKAHFYRIAQGSLYETIAALTSAAHLNLVSPSTRLEVRKRFHGGIKLLVGLIRSVETPRGFARDRET